MDELIRWLTLRLVRLFYPHVEIHRRERLPAAGPAIFVVNHPNALIDPLLLIAVLDRQVAFLAKSTLFKNPFTGRILRALGVMPVYRKQDSPQAGGAADNSPARNEQTFQRCRALLSQGRMLALFPEGETHSGSLMLPAKTGAARIALSAEAEAGWQLGVRIVPVGLWYQNKTRFRSAVLLVVGEPFAVADYREAFVADERQAARNLTARIARELSEVVLQAESAEILEGSTTLAEWLEGEERRPTLAQLYERAAALLSASRAEQHDSGIVERLAQQARRFSHGLQHSGFGEHWSIHLPEDRRRRTLVLLALLLPSLPLAATGLALSYLPYQLTRLIAPRLIRHQAQLGTSKLALGSGLMLANWLALAAMLARRAGRRRGLQLLLAAPLLSYIALRWSEGWRDLRALLNLTWLHSFRAQAARRLVERRAQLKAQIDQLLHEPQSRPEAAGSQKQQEH